MSNISVGEVAHRTRFVAKGSQAAGVGDGHILVAAEAGHNSAEEAGHIPMAAEAGHNLAAEEDIRHTVVHRLTHRTALEEEHRTAQVEEHHIALLEAHCSLAHRVHDRLVHLWCHTTSQPHRGEV